jgi:phospholipid/cholesterol/gamma-HCH transport system ATP-binding protein
VIEFRGLHKALGGRPVLRGVELTVPEGETLALLGVSGGGKSTLLKHAIGLLQPDAGQVLVDGVRVSGATEAELRAVRRSVGYVFQNAALLDSLTVGQNLFLAQVDEGSRARPADCRAGALELLLRVNLEADVLDRYPAELSGGMRKRAGVARAIARRPKYLLWDEPTTGLDPLNAELIDELILELGRQLGVTNLVVTHDLDTAFRVARRVALLHEGRIHACGAAAEIEASADPVVRRFLGRGRRSGTYRQEG